MPIAEQLKDQIKQGIPNNRIKIIRDNHSYTNPTVCNGKVQMWSRNLLTGKTKFVNI